MSGDSLDETAKFEMKQAFEAGKKNWLVTDKSGQKKPGLFKPEFVGIKVLWLTAKCYLAQTQEQIGKSNYFCKGVSKKNIDWYFERCKDVLDVFQKTRIDSELKGEDIDKAKNVQSKLGLSAYYHKRYMLTDCTHIRSVEF